MVRIPRQRGVDGAITCFPSAVIRQTETPDLELSAARTFPSGLAPVVGVPAEGGFAHPKVLNAITNAIARAAGTAWRDCIIIAPSCIGWALRG